MLLRSLVASLTLAPASLALQSNDFVVPFGQVLVYDTDVKGPLIADNVIIEQGGALKAFGTKPLKIYATGQIRIDGYVDLSAFDNLGVATLNTTNIPEPGSNGGPGGGRGGTGSWAITATTLIGGKGFGPVQMPGLGGGGGESTFSQTSPATLSRRGSGGGGGRFAADQGVDPNPEAAANIGLVAMNGKTGSTTGFGAITMQFPSHGGRSGLPVFHDSDFDNDFFGRALDPTSGLITVGELVTPIAGCGGGAGGNAIYAPNGFPPTPFNPQGDEKGAGGGGGGGLGVFVANEFVLGAQGRLRCDGGKGGGGENTIFLDRVGGGSGGGSGGMLLIQAAKIDLSAAPDKAITALGGQRGAGKANIVVQRTVGQGGHGGPGLIQLHCDDPSQVLVPAGKTLSDLASPVPYVLLSEPNL
ncbi:MAG: hypothetical protein K8S98_07705 [Planctomycetes bacterium]|nr:hypothetical protein [Planctomycetota bacterium]